MSQPRNVLIPGTRKAAPHPWRPRLAIALGQPDPTDELLARAGRIRVTRRRWVSGGTPYRNPNRAARLARNGRLRKDIQP